MRGWLLLLLLIPSVAWGVVNTNTASVTLPSDGAFGDFTWEWAGFDDQECVLTISPVLAGHTWTFKVSRQTFTGAVAYLIVSNANISVTNGVATFSVANTNIPPDRVYQASLRATAGGLGGGCREREDSRYGVPF